MEIDPILREFEMLSNRKRAEPLIRGADETWAVDDVARLTAAVEDHVQSAGYPPRSLVGLAARNGAGFIAAFLALRRLGHAVLLLDWNLPAPECARIGESLSAAGILSVDRQFPRSLDHFRLQSFASSRSTNRHPFPDNGATVRLTSGSTGMPQGIVHTSDALVADDSNLKAAMGLCADEKILASIPMSHAYGFISVFLPSVLRGSLLVLPRPGDPFSAPKVAYAGNVTFLPTVPSYLRAVLNVPEPPPLPDALKLIISAGAPLAPEIAVRFREVYGRRVHVFYGASEVGGIAFDKEGTAGERGTVGTPVGGVDVTLEPIDGTELGVGRVTVRSEAVALGYSPQPLPSLSDGCFQSTDLAVFQDGEIVLRGRLDDVINVKGKMVNPREVEAVLRSHENIGDAAVFGAGDITTREQRVCAVVECSSEELRYDDVRSWCQQHLALHKVPRVIVLVSELPRNERGKLDRPAIRALADADR